MRLEKHAIGGFGIITSLKFVKDRGYAKCKIGFPEIRKILNALDKHEKNKKHPKQEVIAAIKILSKYVFALPVDITADIVLGTHIVKFDHSSDLKYPHEHT